MSLFGTSGLIEANIKAYFKAREKGNSVEDSLIYVLNSRYPFSEQKRERVLNFFQGKVSETDDESQKVKKLVLEILFEEYPNIELSEPKFGKDFSIKPSALQQAESRLNDTYDLMKRKYNLSIDNNEFDETIMPLTTCRKCSKQFRMLKDTSHVNPICPSCLKLSTPQQAENQLNNTYDSMRMKQNPSVEKSNIAEPSIPHKTIKSGRKIVVFIIITTIIMSIYAVILEYVIAGPNNLSQETVGVILTLVLSYYLYERSRPARVIAIILYSLSCLGGIVGGIAVLDNSLIGLMLLIPGFIYALCTIFLLFSGSVKNYFSKI